MKQLIRNVELAIKEAIEDGDEDAAEGLVHLAYSMGIGLK